MNPNKLIFVRQCNPYKDMIPVGKITTKHQLYMHSWSTGYQELIFDNETDARRFAESNQCDFKGPR